MKHKQNFSNKKFLLSLLAAQLLSCTPSLAFEDYMLMTNGRLGDISIENNKIVDVYPLITVMNEKNTLIIHPLMKGSTRFCVLKNGKEKVMFSVTVADDKTTVSDVEGFSVLRIDAPPEIYEYDIDMPPMGGIN